MDSAADIISEHERIMERWVDYISVLHRDEGRENQIDEMIQTNQDMVEISPMREVQMAIDRLTHSLLCRS